jgi:hypothetical protein
MRTRAMSISRAVKPVRTSVRVATEHQSDTCPVQPSGNDFIQEEDRAVRQIAKVLVNGVARARWTRALYNALGDAQRIEGRGEREHLTRAFDELSH